MGVRKDLRTAVRRGGLTGRARVELVREGGGVREVRVAWGWATTARKPLVRRRAGHPRPGALEYWPAVRKRPVDTPVERLLGDQERIADVQKAVDHANEADSRAESIRRFRLVAGEFTDANGLLTPSLKVKRRAVAAAYAHEIEELYGQR